VADPGRAREGLVGLTYSPRPLCSDIRLSRRTAHVLGELDYDRVGFTHGPEIVDGARVAVRGFLAAAARSAPE
jgi:hypothetical protein